jgi:hypothetical protein
VGSDCAELCLFLGYVDEYRNARRALLARFGENTDPQMVARSWVPLIKPPFSLSRGSPGDFISSCLQFGRVAIILTFVDCQSGNSATFDAQSTGKEADGVTVVSCSADI